MKKGSHCSEEQKRRMSETSKKYGLRPPSRKGIQHTVETILKMKLSQRGRKHSEETKRKISRARMGMKFSEEHRKNIGLSKKGEKSSFWKGGITLQSDKRIKTSEWKEIRKKVYARDNWTCQICGKKCNEYKGQIQCHHIVPYRITQDNSIGNLITLCSSCHIKEEWKYYRQLKGQSEFSFW